MAADNRDWYRDWWRKKTGYVERADFRIPERQRQRKRRAAALRALCFHACAVALLLALAILIKHAPG